MRGTVESARAGWRPQPRVLAATLCFLFVWRPPPSRGGTVPAVSRARRPGVVPGHDCLGPTLLLPGGARVALWQSLLGGLRAPGAQGLSGAHLGPSSRAVPWVEEGAPVGSRAAACPSSPLGRPPSFSAALWMKCPDGQGPAGRGLGRAWNSPCSGIRFGQRPGSRGRSHLLAASSLPACSEVERQRPVQPAPPCSG